MQIPALSGVLKSSGAEYLGIDRSGQIAIMKAGDWSEDKHPRADNGQFGSGGGSGKGKSGKTKRKLERRSEAAHQATLGGGKAIQTLLGGGSALDKIGWLNTSKKPEAAKKPAKAPEKKPAEAPAKPPAANVKSAKDTIRENLKSGKLKRETVIDAVKSLQEQANKAKSKGDYAASKNLNFQAAIMAEAAEIKPHELISSTSGAAKKPSRNAPGRVPTDVRNDPRNDPFAGDPLHDPLPRGYGVRSPKETERYARAHPPPKKETAEDYDRDYKARTGRDYDPTIA